jgi:hypothetical protein
VKQVHSVPLRPKGLTLLSHQPGVHRQPPILPHSTFPVGRPLRQPRRTVEESSASPSEDGRSCIPRVRAETATRQEAVSAVRDLGTRRAPPRAPTSFCAAQANTTHEGHLQQLSSSEGLHGLSPRSNLLCPQTDWTGKLQVTFTFT